MSSTMRITVNGAPHQLNAGARVIDLVDVLKLDPRKVAVERNFGIVPHSQYAEIELAEGDVVEIVGFIGGG